MPDKPLLIFSNPNVVRRSKRGGGAGKATVHFPDFSRQRQRLNRAFRSMRQSFVSLSAANADAESVIVIETVGKIENFQNATKHIAGLEWLGEEDVEDVSPDRDFYFEKEEERDKELSGRVYLTMSNQRAMNDLYSLWQQWDAPDKKLPYKFGKYAELFSHIKEMRLWNEKDRLEETEILKYWQEELSLRQGSPKSKIPFEIELWYRNDPARRDAAEQVLRALIETEKGDFITSCVISDIRFHAIKGALPAENIQHVIEHQYTDLFKAQQIMFFRPSGQSVGSTSMEGFEGEEPHPSDISSSPPIVAIFDGLPISNHVVLSGKVIVDDPDNYESQYPVNQRRHGTAITSLVCCGDLEDDGQLLSRPVYLRPILKFVPDGRGGKEQVPHDVFFEDILWRSVKRLFDGEDGIAPTAPTVKVINLSVADPNTLFVTRLSSCARLLDYLSCKYNVLFCVSAGNIVSDIQLGISQEEFSSLADQERRRRTYECINRNIRHRRLLSPSEALNVLTIGAVHRDNSSAIPAGAYVDIIPGDGAYPSPITPFGLGYRGSVKPEIFYDGGRQLYQFNESSVSVALYAQKPGHQVAVPSADGSRRKRIYTRGTSNAAALVTRNAARLYDVIEELKAGNTFCDDDQIAVLLKALLIHGASWDSVVTDEISSTLFGGHHGADRKKNLTRWLGYGIPAFERLRECTERRATIIGCNRISKDEGHEYIVPLPHGLSGLRDMRRMIATLAWLSPLNMNSRKYRKAKLFFDFKQSSYKSKLGVESQNAWHQFADRGTVEHHVFEGNRVKTFSEDETFEFIVSCMEDSPKLTEQVPYALAVTLEVAEGVPVEVYEEIRSRIKVLLEVVRV